MKQKMNFITFLVFLYAGVVCAVMKPESRNDIVINNSNKSIIIKPISGPVETMNKHVSVSSKTLFVHGPQ